MSIIRTHRFFRVLRFARLLLLPLAMPTALLAGGLYRAVPPVMESDWGRRQVEHGLFHAFGADVSIGRIGWSWRKGITLEDVSLVPADGSRTARLHIDKARFKPRFRKLFSRRLEGELALTNPVLELQDGAPTSLRWPRPRGKGIRIRKIRVNGGMIVFHPSEAAAPVVLENLQAVAQLEWSRKRTRLWVNSIRAVMNGGSVSGHGWLATDRGQIAAEVSLQGADIASPPEAVISAQEPAQGFLDFELQASSRGASFDEAWRTATGEGWFALREGRIDEDTSFRIRDGRLLRLPE